ncbi:GNAT family N-acetyltransferase [Maritalea porphyrae]|uniref:GNAT family N-acetyltransferase n=1 Tax=Maritalea porphyrae TaxID=880732 RepID=UPI0022B03E19|nr:GNAT family N-acetyltransferase [Maritalea porphyrae]MCZ4273965.1 GNAT family N-acetyltransferase [Maritalea porphyrae]
MRAVSIRRLVVADISAATDMLVDSFLDDQGMVVLFRDQGLAKLHRAMRGWFLATLDMWLEQKQHMYVAFDGDQLVGVLIAGHTRNTVTGLQQLKWAWRVGLSCGLTPILRTAQHDAERRAHFKGQAAHIVEFVGVSAKARGKGVGRQLFDQFHAKLEKGATVWLETTRDENLSIFAKLGYRQCAQSTSLGVRFTQMLKQPTKEKNIAAP